MPDATTVGPVYVSTPDNPTVPWPTSRTDPAPPIGRVIENPLAACGFKSNVAPAAIVTGPVPRALRG